MVKFASLSLFFLQVVLAFVFVFGLLLLHVVLSVDASERLSTLQSTSVYYVLLIATRNLLIICLLLGLPIRLIAKFRSWWASRPMLPFVCLLVGLALYLLLFDNNWGSTAIEYGGSTLVKKRTLPVVVYLACFLLITFSLLHMHPKAVFKWFTESK